MALPLPRRRPRLPQEITIGKLNIWDVRHFGLAQDIRQVEHRGFDVMLLTETKIQIEAYSHNFLGYDVTFMKASPASAKGSQGEVGLVTRERPNHWGIESTRFQRPNVVSCKIVTGPTWIL